MIGFVCFNRFNHEYYVIIVYFHHGQQRKKIISLFQERRSLRDHTSGSYRNRDIARRLRDEIAKKIDKNVIRVTFSLF